MTLASIIPSIAFIFARTSRADGMVDRDKGDLLSRRRSREAEARDIYVVVAEDSRHFADNPRTVDYPEMEESAFGHDIEAELVIKHDPAEAVRKDRARDHRLHHVGLHLEYDEVVEFVELFRLRLFDRDIPVHCKIQAH